MRIDHTTRFQTWGSPSGSHATSVTAGAATTAQHSQLGGVPSTVRAKWQVGHRFDWLTKAAAPAAGTTAQHSQLGGSPSILRTPGWQVGGRFDWLTQSAATTTTTARWVSATGVASGALERFRFCGTRVDWGAVTAAAVSEDESVGGGGSRRKLIAEARRKLLLREDEELIDFCVSVTLSRLLDG